MKAVEDVRVVVVGSSNFDLVVNADRPPREGENILFRDPQVEIAKNFSGPGGTVDEQPDGKFIAAAVRSEGGDIDSRPGQRSSYPGDLSGGTVDPDGELFCLGHDGFLSVEPRSAENTPKRLRV